MAEHKQQGETEKRKGDEILRTWGAKPARTLIKPSTSKSKSALRSWNSPALPTVPKMLKPSIVVACLRTSDGISHGVWTPP